MRLFPKRSKAWVPNYLVAESGRPVWGWISGHTANEAYLRPVTSSERPIGDKARVMRWGDLSRERTAQIGLEAFMGMISVRHGENCHHFWCSPPGNMNIVVEFYLSGVVADRPTEEKQPPDLYIGAYLFPLEYEHDGSAYGYDDKNPVQKLIVQPVSDGTLHVFKGVPTQKYGGPSFYDGGIIDPDTREPLRVLPRQMPRVVEDTTGKIIPRFGFRYGASERKWQVMRILSDGKVISISQNAPPKGYDTYDAYRQLR